VALWHFRLKAEATDSRSYGVWHFGTLAP